MKTIRVPKPWPVLFLTAMLIAPGLARGSDAVAPGWDLFMTQPDTVFRFPCPAPMPAQTIEFEGLPLDTFDFGGAIGVRDVGLTDTIVERLEEATGNGMIAIEIVALSLVSVEDDVVVCGMLPPQQLTSTLNVPLTQSAPSTMTIGGLDSEGNPHGSFSARLHVGFDVSGSVSGLIGSFEKTFMSSNENWNHEATGGTLLIDGVNFMLDGATTAEDFFPVGLVIEDAGDGRHLVRSTPRVSKPPIKTPAMPPWGWLALALALLSAVGFALRHRRSPSTGDDPRLP